MRRTRTITYEQDEVRRLIKYYYNEIELLSEDIVISKCYDDLEMAKSWAW